MAPDRPTFTKRLCAVCGQPALVVDSDTPYLCAQCAAQDIALVDEPGERTVSRFWGESRSGAGSLTAQGLGALDEVFNPGAARAKEQLKADHQRQLPVPSPGDDALRTGSLVIRVPKPRPRTDN